MVGGIAGNNYGTIENCFVNGHVESDHYHSSKDADLGGIVGLNESGGTVKYCFMSGDVKNTDGNSGVGGIAGSNEGTIEHVTFFGSVSVDHSDGSENRPLIHFNPIQNVHSKNRTYCVHSILLYDWKNSFWYGKNRSLTANLAGLNHKNRNL